jgi:hypothetical protein
MGPEHTVAAVMLAWRRLGFAGVWPAENPAARAYRAHHRAHLGGKPRLVRLCIRIAICGIPPGVRPHDHGALCTIELLCRRTGAPRVSVHPSPLRFRPSTAPYVWKCVLGGEHRVSFFGRRGLHAPAFFHYVAVQGLAGVTGLATVGLLVARRYRAARLGAASLAAIVVVGSALGKGYVLANPDFTLASSKAHAPALYVLLWSCGIGALVLAPSLVLLFWVFAPARRGHP